MAQRTEKSTRFWAALVLSLLAASVLSAALLFLLREDGSRVEIYRNGALVETLPLDQDAAYEYQGESGGGNTVVIQNGQVAVTQADCPDQVCVRHGPTDRTGDPIVCLPHKLVVEVVDGTGEAALDGVS